MLFGVGTKYFELQNTGQLSETKIRLMEAREELLSEQLERGRLQPRSGGSSAPRSLNPERREPPREPQLLGWTRPGAGSSAGASRDPRGAEPGGAAPALRR